MFITRSLLCPASIFEECTRAKSLAQEAVQIRPNKGVRLGRGVQLLLGIVRIIAALKESSVAVRVFEIGTYCCDHRRKNNKSVIGGNSCATMAFLNFSFTDKMTTFLQSTIKFQAVKHCCAINKAIKR